MYESGAARIRNKRVQLINFPYQVRGPAACGQACLGMPAEVGCGALRNDVTDEHGIARMTSAPRAHTAKHAEWGGEKSLAACVSGKDGDYPLLRGLRENVRSVQRIEQKTDAAGSGKARQVLAGPGPRTSKAYLEASELPQARVPWCSSPRLEQQLGQLGLDSVQFRPGWGEFASLHCPANKGKWVSKRCQQRRGQQQTTGSSDESC